MVRTEWALRDVSFTVARNETYGLLGPNGSGKSTLIRILATLLIPDAGLVEILGHSLPEGEREIRRNIGRVSVDAAFYKKLSARENLVYTGMIYGLPAGEAERRGREILEELGFSARRYNDALEEMSRGMQQKVTIARALMINPPVLLLDEPTTGLDPRSKLDVHLFLERLREQHGTTILLTTHDMAEADRLSAHIGMLAKGQLVAEGTPEELKRHAGVKDLEQAFLQISGEELSFSQETQEEPV